METTGKVVDALKGQPLALVLVIVNVLFLFGTGWAARDFMGRLEAATQRKDELISSMVQKCFDDRSDQRRENSR